ncbi:ATP-binding protein [Thalassospira sp.]|uniref:ATP-binding protein n=1 Tax=Thalassospira sp. TaxID=1912094 RepID=UPI003AA81B26
MIETLAFRTQARTVDHLGREQIADCPTAISELWKNAYDAYARAVSLHIFDDPEPIAAIFDDGHGMSFDEFVNRWLVVGTESKYEAKDNIDDRDGLPKRSKQGQKGIGRLSSANLGPLLLIVSKRVDHDFIAALIDWRIFENPFLVLSDIELPVMTFTQQQELFDLLPEMFDRLTDNIWGNENDPKRSERLKIAWEAYDRIVLDADSDATKPSELIAGTIINARFDNSHFEPWPVWTDKRVHGTALVVSDINYDLRAQLPSIEPDGDVARIQESFFATLSAFTDPYVDSASNEVNAFDPDFTYEVRIWANGVSQSVIEDDSGQFNRFLTEQMEHVLSGNIDADGVFRGQVKAFGEWQQIGTDYVIYPPKDYKPPKGPTTYLGPVGLHIATYERDRVNSTHTDDQHARNNELAEKYSGFLVFRNGLRVLPYGRIDNDFFEVESRRSISAGREFWNARRMFGRVAISREANPNLRDKAGREGFIDNRSAKALRTLVINILRRVAYEYFGSSSDLRKDILPGIQEKNRTEKAEIERKEIAKKNRKKFSSRLKKNLPLLAEFQKNISVEVSGLQIENEGDLQSVLDVLNEANKNLSDFRLTAAPANLGSSEEDYRTFRLLYSEAQELIRRLNEAYTEALERIRPAKPEAIAERQMQSFASRLQAKLRVWRKSIADIQQSEQRRVDSLFNERNKAFHGLAVPLVEQVRLGRLDLNDALEKMSEIHSVLDMENEDTFQSYLDALELMSENVNIELVASQGIADNIALRDDLNNLNQIAQLGITVEILGHELNTNARLIREGLRQVKTQAENPGTELIETGFEALSQQLEFLSPLKVSGTRTRRKMTGFEIGEYLRGFFDTAFRSRGISLDVTADFERFEIVEQPSRLLPVFVNLVNNSVYWLVNSRTENPKILISCQDQKVTVSDNGPGIDTLDQESLFKMFFTRKVSGGRGIGLYLCRVNLLAGGHSIQYVKNKNEQLLDGANFVIDFNRGNHG